MLCNVSEIYVCHLGEGTAAGKPATLVRLAGCNIHCAFCDTRFACDGPSMDLMAEEVVERCVKSGLSTILLTGGEPLLQLPVSQAIVELATAQGLHVIIETNGTLPVEAVSRMAELVVDVKAPGSGVTVPFHEENLQWLKPTDQLKFVLTSRTDYEWACEFVASRDIPVATGNILFSSAAGEISPQALSKWLLADRLPYRFHIQLHKAVWGDRRGV
jgi:7-carboxy-7-deazaguanine synthase